MFKLSLPPTNEKCMVQVGKFNVMKVLRAVDFGLYLDDGAEGILLPKRFVPKEVKAGDELNVFIYHDSEDRLIATTQKPLGVVGDIVKLKAVTVTEQGAFLDWGLMKDLFVPKSQQLMQMRTHGEYLVKIYIDEQTGRVAATERVEQDLQNTVLSVTELEAVQLIVLRRTDIGYVVIINGVHTGVLHHNEIYRNITEGNAFTGFIKKIYAPDATHDDYRIDVSAGSIGYDRVEDEGEKILRMLNANNGFLPYHDKTPPEVIYDVFGMSKKTFKMALGKLYRQKTIVLQPEGIQLATA